MTNEHKDLIDEIGVILTDQIRPQEIKQVQDTLRSGGSVPQWEMSEKFEAMTASLERAFAELIELKGRVVILESAAAEKEEKTSGPIGVKEALGNLTPADLVNSVDKEYVEELFHKTSALLQQDVFRKNCDSGFHRDDLFTDVAHYWHWAMGADRGEDDPEFFASLTHKARPMAVELASKLALVTSEVSEVLEDVRTGAFVKPSEKIPAISAGAEELADVVIRIMDIAETMNFDLGDAILKKMAYNKKREFKHGGKII